MIARRILIVSGKELVELRRDGRLRLLLGIILFLGVAALGFGVNATSDAQRERTEAMRRAKQQWEGQGKKNPHVAAHFGTFVFKPISVVSAIDPGVSDQLGRSIKMEAHKRNLAKHRPNEASIVSQQFGGFSVSLILLQLVPLLIIALGYGMWGLERERGTLRQLLSTGVERGTLFWGKVIALMTALAALIVPSSLAVVGVLSAMSDFSGDVMLRLLCLFLGYFIYFMTFGGLTLALSAIVRSSQLALVAMVVIWGAFCLLVPRWAVESAAGAVVLPSQAELARLIDRDLVHGISGEAERDAAVEALIKDILAKEGFANAGMMIDPAMARGAELKAEAQWEDMVFDHHVNRLNLQIQAQEDHVSGYSILSPFLAMTTISKALCGTDFRHHQHFSDAAEVWRKRFVDMLNETFAKESGAEGWQYKAGPEIWSKAPPFQYQLPGVGEALKSVVWSLLVLVLWMVGAFVGAYAGMKRMKVA